MKGCTKISNKKGETGCQITTSILSCVVCITAVILLEMNSSSLPIKTP